MRKILKRWGPRCAPLEMPLAEFIVELSAIVAMDYDASIQFSASGDNEGCAEWEVEITRPETDEEKAAHQVAMERQRKLDAIAAREIELLQYEMLKGKYGG